ncbi:hypothetical protein KM176_10215 [Pseudooceanicola sp. CBS1P-1]|uniref:DUF6314 domain-containing protein n=1 Tax=Pseudooceanicola albus TaxID=2692189 RepID=A0A6L7GAV5_9RHOB|nr:MULTISPECIES: DUF6314 family protein [Pseudooceanicola]MBT9384230.1 hypothetical protein [Pseudooceanicola endophyticus]MXN20822.1 hypothetical protein [Pseudooceanicola albus]
MQITDFEGDWRIDRRIEDRRGGQSGRFRGTARLERTPEGHWLWQEDGFMQLGPALPVRATRRYLWAPEGPRIQVFFDDGRFFHAFDPRGVQSAADHQCLRDHYAVSYAFDAWPAWQARWQVRGPMKDYCLISDYFRDAA